MGATSFLKITLFVLSSGWLAIVRGSVGGALITSLFILTIFTCERCVNVFEISNGMAHRILPMGVCVCFRPSYLGYFVLIKSRPHLQGLATINAPDRCPRPSPECSMK